MGSPEHRLTALHGMRETTPLKRGLDGKYVSYKNVDQGEIWDNVHEHCYAAMLVTDVLGEALGLSNKERSLLNTAAYIHDSGKKTERMWQIALEDTDEKIIALANVASMEEWEHAELGLDPKITHIAKSNIPTKIQVKEGHRSLAEKIMWFADACLTGVQIVSIRERFKKLKKDSKNGQRNIEFSNSYIPLYGKSLYNIQLLLGKRYMREFSKKLGISEDVFFDWLKEKVEERRKNNITPVMDKNVIFPASVY